MLCRDLEAARIVRDEILAECPTALIHPIRCDLASFASVRESILAVHRVVDRISLLINNAGIVSARHRMSVDGFELTFATNHLGPFLLTKLLMNRMAPAGRIINVASRAHFRARLDQPPSALASHLETTGQPADL
jgi:NAD(P)-dependent dehydrogenase (short-subunit alcohol dehydrogenase family)